jgi:hypothetical protein
VLDRRQREDRVERVVRERELPGVHVPHFEVRLAIGIGRERRGIREHRSICLALVEAPFAVDIGRHNLGDPIREPEQHGLVTRTDGENPCVLAKES